MQSKVFSNHEERVVSLAFSPNSELLATTGYDNTVRLWSLEEDREIETFAIESIQDCLDNNWLQIDSSSKVTFDPNGKIITLGNGYGSIISWDVETRHTLRKFIQNGSYSSTVAFCPHGELFAKAHAADFPNQEESLSNLSILELAELSPSAFGQEAGSIKIISLLTGQQVHEILNAGMSIGLAFNYNRQLLCNINMDGYLQVWNLQTGMRLRCWNTYSQNTVKFSVDTRLLAADTGNDIKVYDLNTSDELFILTGHSNQVMDVAFSPDSRFLASASADNTIKLWELSIGSEVASLSSPSTFAIAISPDGRRLASANFDHTVRVWDMPSY